MKTIFRLHPFCGRDITVAKLKFAIVGVGNIAPIHATAIQTTPDCELAAAVTRNAERGRAFVDQYGGKWFADYRAVLARADVDVVSISNTIYTKPTIIKTCDRMPLLFLV